MSKTIGVCMIVRNEEAMLASCLESVNDADAIYISDTGSEDRTVEIAREYTGHVYTEDKWKDDFAAARNWIKAKARTDWILSIDADECLQDFGKVREAVALAVNAVNCHVIAADNGQHNLFPRLFRNAPEIYWCGAAHNYVNLIGENVGDVRITFGYSPAHHKDPDRTLRILEREVRDPSKVRERFYLGRELFYKARYQECVVTLGQYVQMSKFPGEKAEGFLIMARAYSRLGDSDSARDACAQALIANPHFREACLYMAELCGDGRGVDRWQSHANQWRRMAETADNSNVLFVRACG